MHLERRSVHNLPPGAIIVSDKDALSHYHNQIYGPYKNKKDLWPFNYGIGLASAVSTITGSWLTSHYLNRFRLQGVGAVFCYILGAGFPSLMAAGVQFASIQSDIFLQKVCVNCVHAKATVYQNIFGVLFPIGPSALLVMIAAGIKGSYDFPGFNTIADAKESFKLYATITKRIYPRILVCVLANSLAATYVTGKQYEAFGTLNQRLRTQDVKLRQLAAEYESRQEGEK